MMEDGLVMVHGDVCKTLDDNACVVERELASISSRYYCPLLLFAPIVGKIDPWKNIHCGSSSTISDSDDHRKTITTEIFVLQNLSNERLGRASHWTTSCRQPSNPIRSLAPSWQRKTNPDTLKIRVWFPPTQNDDLTHIPKPSRWTGTQCPSFFSPYKHSCNQRWSAGYAERAETWKGVCFQSEKMMSLRSRLEATPQCSLIITRLKWW